MAARVRPAPRAQAAGAARRRAGRALGLGLPAGADQGGAVRLRRPVGPRPYFEYRRVRDGVLEVTGALFGLAYRRGRGRRAWHPDVETYDVLEGERAARPHPPRHAPAGGQVQALRPVHAGLRPGRPAAARGGAGLQLPAPAGGAPALLEHAEVRTLFHEFGHLLHHVLGGHTRWRAHSGVATEWDFVEAPSQMLEEWVWDPAVLAGASPATSRPASPSRPSWSGGSKRPTSTARG